MKVKEPILADEKRRVKLSVFTSLKHEGSFN